MEATVRKVNTAEKAEKIDIASYVYDVGKGLRRHWVSILVLVSLAASLFYGMAMRAYVPRYTSSATVIINLKSSVNYSESASAYYTQSAMRQITQTFPYIASSGVLKNLIINEYGTAAEDAEIKASEMQDLTMLTLRVSAGDPKLAYNILQSVLENYSEIAVSVIGETEITVVTPAQVASRADNPSQPISQAWKGALGALAAAIVILLLRSYMKKTVRAEDDFRRYFNLNSLGGLPHIRPRKNKETGQRLVRVDGQSSMYAYKEAVRTLRSRIERDHAENGSKVYMVSSALAGEGKSTVSANLAISLAEKGYSVILMDMDLRNSSILDVMGLPQSEKGLADLFAGEASVRDILVVDEKSGVTILPGGNAGKRSVQVLSTERPAMLLETARDEADYIIVDTPPSGILSDAATIVSTVDAGIFVIRQDYAPVDRILEGIKLLSDTGLRIVGCVLNNVDTGVVAGYGRYARYGYGRYGYGRYGYGYGYGRNYRYGYGYGHRKGSQHGSESGEKKTEKKKKKPFSSGETDEEEAGE